MALEAVVFPQEHLACTGKAAVSAHSPSLGSGIDIDELEDKGGIVLQEEAYAPPYGAAGAPAAWDAAFRPCSIASGALEQRCDAEHRSVSPVPPGGGIEAAVPASRRRRRRPKAAKNREEMESQRRNHIAVERNRRRQMNEYLAVLRSVMPPSYAQRGDQASIVAGAINFVKELEQLLQSLEAQKHGERRAEPRAAPFARFFAFPQYTAGAAGVPGAGDGGGAGCDQSAPSRGVADIEVAVAESHANVKVVAPRRPQQLLRMVVALQCLGLAVLHLNITATADHQSFYTFSLRMEDQCRLSSVDEIAAAVNEIVEKISNNDRVSQLAS